MPAMALIPTSLQVFHENAFPGLVDQVPRPGITIGKPSFYIPKPKLSLKAFLKLAAQPLAEDQNKNVVEWAQFSNIVAEACDTLPSVLQGMRGAAATLSRVEVNAAHTQTALKTHSTHSNLRSTNLHNKKPSTQVKDLLRICERLVSPQQPLDILGFTSLYKVITARLIVSSVVCGSVPPFEGVTPEKLSLVKTQLLDVLSGRPLNFNPKKFDILQESALVLDDLKTVLDAHPGVRLRVEAHADSAGKPNTEALDVLSERRAQSCVEYLIQKGVAPRRLASKGWGARHPLGSGDSKRVEFTPF